MVASERKGEAKGRAEGRAEGREEGLTEGIEKGRMAEKIANAKSMKSLGVDASVITQVTGLSVEEVEAL